MSSPHHRPVVRINPPFITTPLCRTYSHPHSGSSKGAYTVATMQCGIETMNSTSVSLKSHTRQRHV
eukprot:7383801-Prymnesium_polylepis.4